MTEINENVNWCPEAGDSKRINAKDLGISETTLRKRLKTGTVMT